MFEALAAFVILGGLGICQLPKLMEKSRRGFHDVICNKEVSAVIEHSSVESVTTVKYYAETECSAEVKEYWHILVIKYEVRGIFYYGVDVFEAASAAAGSNYPVGAMLKIKTASNNPRYYTYYRADNIKKVYSIPSRVQIGEYKNIYDAKSLIQKAGSDKSKGIDL